MQWRSRETGRASEKPSAPSRARRDVRSNSMGRKWPEASSWTRPEWDSLLRLALAPRPSRFCGQPLQGDQILNPFRHRPPRGLAGGRDGTPSVQLPQSGRGDRAAPAGQSRRHWRCPGQRRSGALVPSRRRAGQRLRSGQSRRHVSRRHWRCSKQRRGGALVPSRRRAGQRRRSEQSRRHVRKRYGGLPKRRRGGALVPNGPPSRAMPTLRIFSGVEVFGDVLRFRSNAWPAAGRPNRCPRGAAQTRRMNGVEPCAWIESKLQKIVDSHQKSRTARRPSHSRTTRAACSDSGFRSDRERPGGTPTSRQVAPNESMRTLRLETDHPQEFTVKRRHSHARTEPM